MKLFTLSLLLVVIITSCKHPKHSANTQTKKANAQLSLLKRNRDLIETYSRQHKSNMLVFAKVPGKETLLKIENDKWPDEVEYSYNVLKDDNGRLS